MKERTIATFTIAGFVKMWLPSVKCNFVDLNIFSFLKSRSHSVCSELVQALSENIN